MTPQTLAARVERLEERVTLLEQLPARVDALTLEISQLREEMRAEFSAVRIEIRAGDEETRRSLREEIRAGDEETRRVLREEIRAGDEETRRVLGLEIRESTDRVMSQARALYEDMQAKLLTINESRPSKPRTRRSKK